MIHEGDRAPTFNIRPIFGTPISPSKDVVGGPLVLTFVGSLASPFVRRWLSAFQDNHAEFDRLGAQVAAVATCGVTEAQDFVPRYHLLFPLAADPEGGIAAAYGVKTDRILLKSLRNGLLQDLRGAMAFGVGWGQGAVRQMPAVFVLDRNGTVKLTQYAAGIADVPDIQALVQCVRSL